MKGKCVQVCRPGGNRIQNPGFEAGLSHWTANNVILGGDNPFEGTAAARLGSGVASLAQAIFINGSKRPSFLFGFAVQSPLSFDPGNMIVQIHWLDGTGKDIGIGLSMVIPSNTIGSHLFWLSYLDATEKAPPNARIAVIIFSKAQGADSPNDVIEIDKVLLVERSGSHV